MALHVKGRVQKWGNSLGIRIPQVCAENCELFDGATVDIYVQDGKLIIRRNKETLDELLQKVTPENRHEEIAWGEAMGSEAW